jgi:hypothetical protein
MNSGRPSIVFAGCARDCARYLAGALANIARFAAGFERTGYVFAENDSADGTPELLQNWLAGRAHSHLLSANGLIASQPARTARIALARNAYLEAIAQSELRGFDYLVMVDLDDVNTEPMSAEAFNAAVDYLERHKDYAALFACSDPVYYDLWALRHPEWCPEDVWAQVRANPLMPYAQAVERFVYSRQRQVAPTDTPIPVQSAFGGLAIYRLGVALSARYQGVGPDGAACCEHVAFNQAVAKHGSLALFPALRNRAPAEHIRPGGASLPAVPDRARGLLQARGGPTVTVITPTIGRPSLDALIESIEHQTMGQATMHLLLWDDFRDRGARLPESYNGPSRYSIVLPPGSGRNGAAPGSPLRAIGLMAAHTPWVTFADDDVRWDSDHLEHLNKALSGKRWASTLRTVWASSGERLGVDRFESVGDEPTRCVPYEMLDNNCVVFERALGVASAWMYRETTQYNDDRLMYRFLKGQAGDRGRTDRATIHQICPDPLISMFRSHCSAA